MAHHSVLGSLHVWLQDVSDESYNEFFKTTFSEFLDPLAHVHFNVEVRGGAWWTMAPARD